MKNFIKSMVTKNLFKGDKITFDNISLKDLILEFLVDIKKGIGKN